MINLLPPQQKKQIKAGRANVILLRYIGILSSGVILLAILLSGTFLVLNMSRANTQDRVDVTNEKIAQYSATKTAAEQFRSDLATAKTILDKEVTYSKLIYKLADAVPSGVVLDSLDLNSKTLGAQTTLSAETKSYEDAIRLKTSFEQNKDLFSDVHFVSVTGGGSGTYPVKASLSVVIKKDALK